MITFCLITFPLVSTAVSDFSDIILPTKLVVFVQCRPVTRPQLPLPLKSKVLTEPTWHLRPQPDMPREIWESFQPCQVTVTASTLGDWPWLFALRLQIMHVHKGPRAVEGHLTPAFSASTAKWVWLSWSPTRKLFAYLGLRGFCCLFLWRHGTR